MSLSISSHSNILLKLPGCRYYDGIVGGDENTEVEKIIIVNETTRGWKGNQTKLEEKQILDLIFTLRNMEDCPDLESAYKINNSLLIKKLKKNLTSPVYIYGSCCRYLPPDVPANSVLEYIWYNVNSLTKKKFEHFKVSLFDQKTSYLIDQFNTDGPEISFSLRESILTSYKVKVSQKVQLEGDPNYECKHYEVEEYQRCVVAEHVRLFLALFSCTPPWVTEEERLWCRGNLNLTAPEVADYNSLSVDINKGVAATQKCPPPCTSTS